jgi:hypothetical protein
MYIIESLNDTFVVFSLIESKKDLSDDFVILTEFILKNDLK